MRKKNKTSKDELKQELIKKYGISDEDFEKLNEKEFDLLTTGIIIILFGIAGIFAVSGLFTR